LLFRKFSASLQSEKKLAMYAIVDIQGQQFKVEKGQTLFVHRLPGEEGSAVEFNKVLLHANEDKINLSNLKKVLVKATILTHLKGDKKIVFKKKRRKGYEKKNGHRQSFTKIQIEDILA
jgi:large subunit ribosomal protein L21